MVGTQWNSFLLVEVLSICLSTFATAYHNRITIVYLRIKSYHFCNYIRIIIVYLRIKSYHFYNYIRIIIVYLRIKSYQINI